MFNVPAHECFSLRMADVREHEEAWPSSSLSLFFFPYALSFSVL